MKTLSADDGRHAQKEREPAEAPCISNDQRVQEEEELAEALCTSEGWCARGAREPEEALYTSVEIGVCTQRGSPVGQYQIWQQVTTQTTADQTRKDRGALEAECLR